MATILFDGVAYGMLLFVLACGLAVTLGLMNFVNLAHGAFAMAGGYVDRAPDGPLRRAVPRLPAGRPSSCRRRSGWCSSARSIVTCTAAATSTRCCSRSASCSWRWRRPTISWARASATSSCRPGCRAASRCCGVGIGVYRSFIIVRLRRARARPAARTDASTRFGSRLRAAVDDARVARGLGIHVGIVSPSTFAVGSGLAGLGGALGAELLGLDPYFPAEVHDLLPDRRHGRRHVGDHGPVRRLAAAGRRRRRRQVLRLLALGGSSSTS